MAKLLKGLFGPISGKVGNMVFVTRNGKSYVQSMPQPSHRKPTERQLEQRTRFGMVMGFATLFKTMVQVTLKSRKPVLTGMNVMVKDILQHAVTGEYPSQQIEYSKVRFTKGYVAGAYHPEVYLAGKEILKLYWAEDLSFNAFSSDQLIVVLYRESLNECWFDLRTGVSRWKGSSVIRIPEAFASRETHVWIAFHSPEQRRYSNSQYLGTLFNKSNR